MTNEVFQERLNRCRRAMREREIDTLILTPGAGMQYLTGFNEEGYERLLCLVIPDSRPPVFLVPSLNADQARGNSAGVADIRGWDDTEGWRQPLSDLCTELALNTGCVGVDDGMPARFLLPLLEMVPRALVKSAGPIFDALRSVKDAHELAAMQRAADLTDAAYHAALRACKPGVTESALAQVIEATIRDAGGELAFETIVGTGPNSALPHHRAGSRTVRSGEVVLFDLGARLNGYCGDITRVVHIGEPTAECAKVYEIVYNAHAAAVAHVKAGVPASFIDRVAREVIAETGYGAQFIHRTGHGIGMEDHEAPNIVHGNDEPLTAGNCFSVEPGIYLPGKFGIRLENIVTAETSNARVFNEPIPPRLMEIGEILSV